MVSIIVGTLIDVGNGRIAVEAIPISLAANDRTVAGKTSACSWVMFMGSILSVI